MDIQTRKINFVQEFLGLQNVKLIEKFEKILLENKAKEYEANLNPMEMDEINTIADNSIEDSRYGKVVDANELKEISKKWK